MLFSAILSASVRCIPPPVMQPAVVRPPAFSADIPVPIQVPHSPPVLSSNQPKLTFSNPLSSSKLVDPASPPRLDSGSGLPFAYRAGGDNEPALARQPSQIVQEFDANPVSSGPSSNVAPRSAAFQNKNPSALDLAQIPDTSAGTTFAVAGRSDRKGEADIEEFDANPLPAHDNPFKDTFLPPNLAAFAKRIYGDPTLNPGVRPLSRQDSSSDLGSPFPRQQDTSHESIDTPRYIPNARMAAGVNAALAKDPNLAGSPLTRSEIAATFRETAMNSLPASAPEAAVAAAKFKAIFGEDLILPPGPLRDASDAATFSAYAKRIYQPEKASMLLSGFQKHFGDPAVAPGRPASHSTSQSAQGSDTSFLSGYTRQDSRNPFSANSGVQPVPARLAPSPESALSPAPAPVPKAFDANLVSSAPGRPASHSTSQSAQGSDTSFLSGYTRQDSRNPFSANSGVQPVPARLAPSPESALSPAPASVPKAKSKLLRNVAIAATFGAVGVTSLGVIGYANPRDD